MTAYLKKLKYVAFIYSNKRGTVTVSNLTDWLESATQMFFLFVND